MFQLPADQRPDGLIITDDHLVEHATAGLRAIGLLSPEELEIVAHCNYPAMPKAGRPVRWLGFDARACVAAGIQLARDMHAGKPPGTATTPALFEEEWQMQNAEVGSICRAAAVA